MIKPMLAEDYDPNEVVWPMIGQPKLNGIRALYNNVSGRFQTRNGKLWKRGVMDHLIKDIQQLFGRKEGYVVDGEFYVQGWSLEKINGAASIMRNEPDLDTLLMEYWIYDRVGPEGYIERRRAIGGSFGNAKQLISTTLNSHEELVDFHRMCVAWGYEGVILRVPSAPYIHARTKALLRYKLAKEYEAQCVGVVEGTGKYRGMMGALELEDAVNGIRFNVGTGFTDAQREFYWANPPIGKLVTVSSKVPPSAKGNTVQCSFVAVRDYE